MHGSSNIAAIDPFWNRTDRYFVWHPTAKPNRLNLLFDNNVSCMLVHMMMSFRNNRLLNIWNFLIWCSTAVVQNSIVHLFFIKQDFVSCYSSKFILHLNSKYTMTDGFNPTNLTILTRVLRILCACEWVTWTDWIYFAHHFIARPLFYPFFRAIMHCPVYA